MVITLSQPAAFGIVSVKTPKFYANTQAKNFSLNVEKLNKLNFNSIISLSTGIKQLCDN